MKTPTALCIALVACLTSANVGRTQCSDPTPPRLGFKYKFEQDKPITLSDGYKTLANVLYPDATPGSCGWPLLVLVHGLSGSRKTPSVEAAALVSQGFFVVQYDVRAQGDARALNKGVGSYLWALDEWIDMAEVIEWTRSTYGTLVDKKRTGVFGDSQGGVHAWAAAAYSGKKLPANKRRTAAFPTITCVVPRYFPPDTVDVFVPDDTAFLYHLSGFAYEPNHIIALLDTTYRTKLKAFIDNDDPKGMAAYMRSLPGKDFMAELKTSTVPVLAVGGWQDTWADPRGVIDAFKTMHKTTPKRLYLSTGTHGMPVNLNQSVRQVFLAEVWFKRFMKGDSEPAEKGPPFTAAAMPPDFAEYKDQTSIWRHRLDRTWPPSGAKPARWYLNSGGKMTTAKASASGGSDTVSNAVSASYDAGKFFVDRGAVTKVKLSIPLNNVSYDSPTLTKDLDLAGNPTLSLYTLPNNANYLLAARLLLVSPTSQVHVIATGAKGTRQTNGPKAERVTIVMSPVACVVPRGWRLRIELRNLDIQKPLDVEVFRRMPFFNSTQTRIEHSTAGQSWFEVGVRDRVVPEITSSDTTMSVTAPTVKQFKIRSSAEWKSAFYVVLLGFSGQGPPQVFPSGSTFWLVPDFGTVMFVQVVNQPVLPNFAGVLDAKGEATCSINFAPYAPLPLSLIGTFCQVGPTFFTFARGFEAGVPVQIRFR